MTAPIRFFLSACLYPSGVLDGSRWPHEQGAEHDPINRPGPPDHAFLRLLQRLAGPKPTIPEWVLLGDQIYVDATAGLLDPRRADGLLARVYLAWKALLWRKGLAPILKPFTLMDDHEVVDNWEPSLHPGRNKLLATQMKEAKRMFVAAQRNGPPPPHGGLWHGTQLSSGQALFIGDTRSERSARDPARLAQAELVSPAQMQALLHHLRQAAPGDWRFVATSSMLLPRRLATAECQDGSAALRSDAWDGYPRSLHTLLGHIAEEGLQRCVFLSGDEHIPCVARIELRALGGPGDQAPVVAWSVHAGSLYGPFPFANSVPEDFATDDMFTFVGPSGKSWSCQVRTCHPRHLDDGFLEISGAAAGPIQVDFRSARGSLRDECWTLA